jgi:thiosulfate reductase/polysulfide reductase chain A
MAKDPFPLKMAIFRRYGIQSFPQPDKMGEALKTLDYVVFCDTIQKDIAYFADMLLPESTFLEKTYIPDRSLPIPGKKLIVSGNAAQKAAGESKGWTGILIDIGKKLDEKRGTKYFWIKDGDKERAVTSADENNSMMASVGMTFDDLKNAKDGVILIDAPYKAKSEYKTTSKKLEIYCNIFKEHGYDPLPGWVEKAAKPSAQYPLYFLVRRHPAMKHSAPLSSDNAHVLDAFPENYAWINAKTAAKLGIKDGDRVEVASPVGKVKINAKVTQRIREDCLMMEHNFGHRNKALQFSGKNPSDGDLVPLRPEKPLHGKEWSGNAFMSDVCVNVRKA